MKEILLSFVLLACAASTQGAIIICTPGQGDAVNNSVGVTTAFTCSPGDLAGTTFDNLSGDGLNIATFQLTITGTWQVNNINTPQTGFDVTFTGIDNIGAGLVVVPDLTCLASSTTNVLGQGSANCNTSSMVLNVTPGTDLIPAFVVNVTGSGTNLPANATASVFYEVTTVDSLSGVPEPSSYGMLGAGLVGMYFARRMKRV